MVIFNALLNLRELKELYSGKPVCVCPLYKGVINAQKTFEATGNPIILPEYKSLVKLKITFSPKQAGTGDQSLENVRPISGYDSMTVTQSKDWSQVTQITLTLPETIYGGTVDAVAGVGEKTWKCIEFDGTEEYIGVSTSYGYQLSYRLSALANADERESSTCSHFKYKPTKAESFWIDSSGVFIRFIPNEISSVEEWKSYLATQAAAGTPVQVAYKLATPEPFEISKISIPSLIGENTFFTNGDNMDIIYKESSFWSDEA